MGVKSATHAESRLGSGATWKSLVSRVEACLEEEGSTYVCLVIDLDPDHTCNVLVMGYTTRHKVAPALRA